MHTLPVPSKSRHLSALTLLIALSASLLGCREQAAPAAVSSAPAAAPAASLDKQQAIAALMALPELKAWSAAIEKNSNGKAHGAVIEYDPAPRVIGAKQYYQLSFVENDKDAAHRWEDFLVGQDGSILVEDGASDKVLRLDEWRASKKPLSRTK